MTSTKAAAFVAAQSLPASGPRPHSRRTDDAWRRLRYGVGLDLGFAEDGNLHLDLIPPRGDVERSWRWRFDETQIGTRWWSLGGGVELLQFRDLTPAALAPLPRGDRRLVLNPQLRLDVDAIWDVPGQMQLTLQQGYWVESASRQAVPNRAWQLALRWRFGAP